MTGSNTKKYFYHRPEFIDTSNACENIKGETDLVEGVVTSIDYTNNIYE